MRLRVRALGLAVGIVWGLGVLVATLWLIWFGQVTGVPLMKKFYLGYDETYLGALVGFIWGFIDGFVAGALIAWLYNKFHKAFYKTEAPR
jgi:fructose-specific phosphotransferase system IIC component